MITMHLVYVDGMSFDLNVPQEEFSAFFADLNKGRVHWDPTNANGFWTSLANIRYIQFTNPVATASTPEIPDSSTPLPEATA